MQERVVLDDAKSIIYDTSMLNRYAKLITMDLRREGRWGVFCQKYKKADVIKFISHPKEFEKELRGAVRFVYDASPHFRRLISYFVGLNDLMYVISPYKVDTQRANPRTMNIAYRSTLNTLSNFSVKTRFGKILTVVLREDVFYGTMHVDADDIAIQQLPSDYCKISSIEEGVMNVAFDFRYFDRHPHCLDNYPSEFRAKYDEYKRSKDRDNCPYPWWIELDSPTSFCVKCNNDNPFYPMPPFAGILPELYDIDDYKKLKLDKTELENYAMLAMRIPMTQTGEWGIDLNKAKDFWANLDSVLPDRVGSVLTPMAIDKISFEHSNSRDSNTIAEAEQAYFTAAGVSSLLFSNDKASANALLLSIKADQMITFGIVKSMQDVINRYIHSTVYGKKFIVTFLDCSPYNRKELGDAYIKAASYGFPTISLYLASQGLGQAEIDSMTFLETKVLNLQDRFRPVVSSSQLNSEALSDATSGETGAPQKDTGELTDSGEQSREDGDDW